MNILEKIVLTKRGEIEEGKKVTAMERFSSEGPYWNQPSRSLVRNLQAEDATGIIGEFKRKSPSKGWFQTEQFPVSPVVDAYNRFGASGISVLTDGPFFGGSINDLVQAKEIAKVPVLRKDFMIDEWQVAQAKAFGADVILLIAACLGTQEVISLARFAKSIGLEVLLEIHNEDELGHICDEIDLVGVNNRNLKTFEVDIRTSLRLIESIPSSKLAISESGISSVDAINTLRKAGYKGFLVGENFMKEDDPGKAFGAFTGMLEGARKGV